MRCQLVAMVAGVGELAHLDVGAAVAQELDSLGAGAGVAGAVHDQICPEAADDLAHAGDAVLRGPEQSMTRSAPNPPTISRTRAMRCSAS